MDLKRPAQILCLPFPNLDKLLNTSNSVSSPAFISLIITVTWSVDLKIKWNYEHKMLNNGYDIKKTFN